VSYVLRSTEPSRAQPASRRWTSLAFVALAQLMVALDATIVSIALPSAQRALGASDAQRQWVITAYTLAFGGLLLAGGRIADTIGRKRTFLIGLAGFALASALGGSARTFAVLMAARALQGAFAALLTPAALSLLATTFTDSRERARAFAMYGAVAGSGAALGLLLGGLLTEYLSWRWCLYVNVPVAVVAAVGGSRALSASEARSRRHFDVPGVVLVSGAMVALVYACAQSVGSGWGSPMVGGILITSVVLLIAFVYREASTKDPLLPLAIVVDRNRGGADIAAGLAVAGLLGAFLLLTYYLQVVRHYSPVQAGLAFLPITLATQAGSWGIASQLLPRVPARVIMAPGALVAAAGMLVLSQIQVGSSYLTTVLPAELLLGAGIACVMVPAFSLGTLGVDPHQSGVAAATVNASTQVGGSLGTALLNTIAASATASYLLHVQQRSPLAIGQGLVHGFSIATAFAMGILVVAAVVSFLLIDTGVRREHHARSG